MLPYNVAKEYANLYGILFQVIGEESWEFRERVARTIANPETATDKAKNRLMKFSSLQRNMLAHEVLYNRRESGNPFAYGVLDDGYGDAHITRMARSVEAAFQAEMGAIQKRQERQKALANFKRILKFWR